MRRSIAVPIAVIATVGALGGCSSSEPAQREATTTPQEKITLTDGRGKAVVLDGPAKRIAGTEWNVVEYSASLGVNPVGVSDIKGFKAWNGAVKLTDAATDLGTRGEPSIDAVNALGLDALFVTDSLVGDATEQIEKHTPVVLLKGGNAKDPIGSMFANVDLVAKATGTEERAAELKRRFEAELAETKALVERSRIADRPIAFSDGYAAGGKVTIRPYSEGSLVGGVLEAVGLRNAWSSVKGLKTDAVYGLGQTDVEGLTKLPADTVFWYIGNDVDGGDVFADKLGRNRVWTSLPFVQRRDLHRFPDSIWMFGGPASMMQLLNAVQAAVET